MLSPWGGHLVTEDCFEVRSLSSAPESFLCVVADGQGGRAGGAAAAQLACSVGIEVASRYPPADLQVPMRWREILHAADEAVCDDPGAGFTTVVAFCVTDDSICGASSGDSAAIAIGGDRHTRILTEHQQKNPPVGSRDAAFVSFFQRLIRPWRVLACSDGVWKYCGLDTVLKVAAQNEGEDIIASLLQSARLPRSGKLQDDFTLLVVQDSQN
jgi:serine/threonine protein phosphatase PrpC